MTTSSKKNFIIKEDILANKNNEKYLFLNEQDFVELDTKQYIDLLRKRFLLYYSKKFDIKNNN